MLRLFKSKAYIRYVRIPSLTCLCNFTLKEEEEDSGIITRASMASPSVLAAALAAIVYVMWLVFVPPKRLYDPKINNVRVIKSRFGGLGAVGFYANRYTLYARLCSSQSVFEWY